MAVVRKKVKTVKETTLEDKVKAYMDIKKKIEEMETIQKQLRNELIDQLGTNFEGKFGDLKLSIKEVEVKRIDSNLLKTNYPEIAEEVMVPIQTVRVSIKGA